MFGSVTSPKRQRVNTLRLIHSLARRACILKGSTEHGAVQLGSHTQITDQETSCYSSRGWKLSLSFFRLLSDQTTRR